MTFAQQAYAERLRIAQPAVIMAMEIASRTPESPARQKLYRQASEQAQRFIKQRPPE
jgi:hypothetical protein